MLSIEAKLKKKIQLVNFLTLKFYFVLYGNMNWNVKF